MKRRQGRRQARKPKPSLQRMAQSGFRGYPIATVAYYGPNNRFASKMVASIVREGEVIAAQEKWFAENVDVRLDAAINREVVQFIERYRVRSVVMAPTIIGCPHQEGIDYPLGEDCPHCPYWAGRERLTSVEPARQAARESELTVTGVAWYRPEQWDRLCEISVDRDDMADTHAEWLAMAEEALRKMHSAGMHVEKVDVDVEELLAWCQAQGREVNGDTRVEYVARLTQQRHQSPS